MTGWIEKYKNDIIKVTDRENMQKNGKYIPDNVYNIITDRTYWRELNRCNGDIKVINKEIFRSERTEASPSDTFYGFNNLLDDDYFIGNLEDSILRRWNLIKSDFHAANFFTDARYTEEAYDIEDYNDAVNYFKKRFGGRKWDEEIRVIFHDFRNKTGVFKDINYLTPKETSKDNYYFWSPFTGAKGGFGELAVAAMELSRIPTSIAGVEGTFNHIRLTEQHGRTNLGPITLDNIVKTRVNITNFPEEADAVYVC